ncbi:Fic family protein [Candidatus Roizmanbacteria bacterium]|nr:Fic family protein [Candidatus Roizmanbacteria bacterium]
MSIFKAGVYKQIEIRDKKIFSLVEEAGNLLGRFNAYSSLFLDAKFFIQMHVIKEATTSSLIEGTKTNIDEILLPKEEVYPERRDDWQEVQNFIKATNFAITQLSKIPLSIRLINDIHGILLSGVRGKYKTPGEIRKSQNWIGGNSLKNVTFTPPHQDDLPMLLSDLEKFWHNEELSIPFLIKVAISHYQFETVHPYLDGNGRIGRLLIILQFVEHGLLEKPTLYLSEYFEKNRTEYYDSLSRVRINNDLDQWLIFFLHGLIKTSEKGIVTFDKIIRLQKNCYKKITTLGRRSELGNKLLKVLFTKPIVNVNKIVEELEITFPTANAIISDFEKIGVFKEVTGFARNRLFSFVEYINLFKNV